MTPPYEEEDFELVLGNRQLFFLAVVLFGVFFAVGYTVGYNRGYSDLPVSVAAVAPPQQATEAQQPSASLAPASQPPEDHTTGEVSEPPAGERPTDDAPGAQGSEPPGKPEPFRTRQAAAPPPPVRTSAPPANTAAPATTRTAPQKVTTAALSPVTSPPTAEARPAPTRAARPSRRPVAASGSHYLQVLARREPAAAQSFMSQLKAKGYPVLIEADKGDGWNRVLLGPLPDEQAVAEYQARLKADGIDSFLRMP